VNLTKSTYLNDCMGKIVKKVGDNKFEVKVAASEEG